jgi:hypothetical protein
MAENRRDESAAKAEGSDAAANVEAGSIGSGISRISATRPVCAVGEQNLKRGAEPSGSRDFGIFPGSAGGACQKAQHRTWLSSKVIRPIVASFTPKRRPTTLTLPNDAKG